MSVMTLREEMRVQEVAAGQPSTGDSTARLMLILPMAPSALLRREGGVEWLPRSLGGGVVGGTGCRCHLGGCGTEVADEG